MKRGLFSSLTNSIPQPATYYASTARKLRNLGVDVRDRDFELIDDFRDQFHAIRENYPEMTRRMQMLTALEGVAMESLEQIRAMMERRPVEHVLRTA